MHNVHALDGKGVHIKEKLIFCVYTFLYILFVVINLGGVFIMKNRKFLKSLKPRLIIRLVDFKIPAQMPE